jgi:hypothetical protein
MLRIRGANMTELERLSLFHRRGYLCEICRKNKATDLHHCLFRRDKRKPELNHEINYEILCHTCHMQGLGDTFDHRCAFYIRQVERYGFLVVMAWLESLPLKIKRWEFI